MSTRATAARRLRPDRGVDGLLRYACGRHAPPVTDSSATAPGLRHSTDRDPGIRRRRSGRGFAYRGPNGRPIRDPETLERIRELAIPPAWTDVWICPYRTAISRRPAGTPGAASSTGTTPVTAAGAKPPSTSGSLAFAKALPAIRKRVDEDLARPEMSREKVLAAVVRLLELTLIRVGNDEYARLNRSFGLTTLRNRHATVRGSSVRFRFRGKSGQQHEVESPRSPSRVCRPPLPGSARPGAVPVRRRGRRDRRRPLG